MKHLTEVKLIRESNKKLQLISYNPRKKIKRKDTLTASIYGKQGILSLSSYTISCLRMEKAFIKLMYDVGHKVIAWKVAPKTTQDDMKNSGWKTVKLDKRGTAKIGVSFILAELRVERDRSYKDLEIKKYTDYKSLIPEDDYYFIEINEHEKKNKDGEN